MPDDAILVTGATGYVGGRLIPRLPAEMKLPGETLLEFRISPQGDGQTELQQLSRFLPKGLLGMVYWYVLSPFHEWIFGGMLSAIARSVGKPVIQTAKRFTPRLHSACALPQNRG